MLASPTSNARMIPIVEDCEVHVKMTSADVLRLLPHMGSHTISML
ncbi:unnamed protein product [Cylicostephanus goldi]|uniref:Uncharacterized protein n=1 Tax=Cylicostephanus goldi TaxID=71465 RepID=A0A3P7NW15_CYLGO|nr:unnamed protein product [Cylicostephanus goldi]